MLLLSCRQEVTVFWIKVENWMDLRAVWQVSVVN